MYATISLRDFIRATTKDIQVAAVEQPPPQQKAFETGKLRTDGDKAEETEEEVPALIRKNSRKSILAEADQAIGGKRRKKERAKKAKHEPR